MDTAIVRIFVGCLLISWNTENSSSLVKVCQNNNGSLINHEDVIIIDAAGASPQRQDIECKCYMSFINGGSKRYISAFIFFDIDTNQNVEFKVNRHAYNTTSSAKKLNITSELAILFRQGYQHEAPRACMRIQKGRGQGRLTVRCSKQETNSTISTHADREDSTDKSTVILCASIGGGVLLVVIVVIVWCQVKRKRRSERHISKDKTTRKGVGKAREPTGTSEEGKRDNAPSSRRTNDKHETEKREIENEYVYIDQCGGTASATNTKDSKASPESDVYNHLNEIQPGPHSDNVYSTTHVFNTTKQNSGAMSQHESIMNPSECDEYNHLNEVRASPHSDNIYNAWKVHNKANQASGATASQYDSVELAKYQHRAQPDGDYNVLSFP